MQCATFSVNSVLARFLHRRMSASSIGPAALTDGVLAGQNLHKLFPEFPGGKRNQRPTSRGEGLESGAALPVIPSCSQTVPGALLRDCNEGATMAKGEASAPSGLVCALPFRMIRTYPLTAKC
jgi:hypothetical protein